MGNRQDNDICKCSVIHGHIVERVKKSMPSEEKFYKMAEFFKAFSDATRVKILYALLEEEMCVCDIAALLGMNQSAVSHQLRVLKHSGLVKYRREGKVVFYSLDDEHVSNVFDQGFAHISHR